jgi:hypothetical protein
MSDRDNGPDQDSDQLEPEDTLDYRGVDDVLDEGYSPADRPWAVDDYGVTPEEEHEGEDLDHRLARENPDPWNRTDPADSDSDSEEDGEDGEGSDDPDWESDTSDTDGELLDGPLLDGEVGERRSGRLVDAAEGGVGDTDPDAWAEDVGIDGAAASAEEAAVHVVDDE